MPKIADARVLSNTCLGNGVWRLTVACRHIAKLAAPGMFVQLHIDRDGLLLRRPLSLADVDTRYGTLAFIYRIVGRGTAALSRYREEETINCMGPLGHGFSLEAKRPLLVGGGMGIAPLLFLAKKFSQRADVLIGGRNQEEMFWPKLFHGYVRNIFIATDDGSLGQKGFTTDLLPNLVENSMYDTIFVCGPEVMMHKVYDYAASKKLPCQVSLEKHMACGLGACLSCTCEGMDGKRRKVCQDGPVFWAEEVFA